MQWHTLSILDYALLSMIGYLDPKVCVAQQWCV
jgi:hypothetical protein